MGGGGNPGVAAGPEKREAGSLILDPPQTNDDFKSDPKMWDVVVVGAGVAGSALACSLSAGGRNVLLLERDLAQPDRIVGELLQPGGYLKLRELGLEDCVDGIDSVKVRGYVMIKNGKEACVKYPVDAAALPKGVDVGDVAGRSFHNGRFVQRLRQRAGACDGVSLREGTVKRLLNQSGEPWSEGEVVGGVAYKRKNEDTERIARGHFTVVCDGMYSGLRKHLSTPEIKHPSYFVGLILKGVKLPKANHAVVLLGDPAPVLFYPISSDEVRCLVDVPGEKLPSVAKGEMSEYLKNLAPQIPESLRAAFLAAVAEGNVRTMQNKQLAANPVHRPGALLLGDSFNMRHPLTGGGMTVCLHDTALLGSMLSNPLDLTDAVATAVRTSEYYTARKPWAATINTLANALYNVFCSDGRAWREEMRQACFDYLRLGGVYANGPISLLGGLNPSPSVLVTHFFMVALYGVGRMMLPIPTPRAFYNGVRLLLGASMIIFPIIRAEGIKQVFFPSLVRRPVAR